MKDPLSVINEALDSEKITPLTLKELTRQAMSFTDETTQDQWGVLLQSIRAGNIQVLQPLTSWS